MWVIFVGSDLTGVQPDSLLDERMTQEEVKEEVEEEVVRGGKRLRSSACAHTTTS